MPGNREVMPILAWSGELRWTVARYFLLMYLMKENFFQTNKFQTSTHIFSFAVILLNIKCSDMCQFLISCFKLYHIQFC